MKIITNPSVITNKTPQKDLKSNRVPLHRGRRSARCHGHRHWRRDHFTMTWQWAPWQSSWRASTMALRPGLWISSYCLYAIVCVIIPLLFAFLPSWVLPSLENPTQAHRTSHATPKDLVVDHAWPRHGHVYQTLAPLLVHGLLILDRARQGRRVPLTVTFADMQYHFMMENRDLVCTWLEATARDTFSPYRWLHNLRIGSPPTP
jgi:hypothetical protein